MSLPNTDQFLKFFEYRNLRTIYDYGFTTSKTRRYTTL